MFVKQTAGRAHSKVASRVRWSSMDGQALADLRTRV